MESVDKFKSEMQARVDELRPYVEEYAQIEQLLAVIDNVKNKAVSNAGAVVAQLEEAVPAFKQEKPKSRKKYTRKATRRVAPGDALKTRVGFVKKYLRENGTKKLAGTREYDGEICFTFGSLMNAMNEVQYEGLTWPRVNNGVTDRLVELNIIELKHQTVGKLVRKYYAVGKGAS